MWWLPLGTAFVLAVAVAFLHSFQHRREVRSTHTYRSKYLQIVSQLEQVTLGVTQLQSFVPKVSDQKILDYFESSLRILETLLQTMGKVEPFGSEPGILGSASFLVRDCEKRIDRTKNAFTESLKGKDVDLDKLYGRKKSIAEKGCYFCSRPTISDRFSRVRVKLDGETKEVLSCNVCKEELKESKKVKVLHLVKDGKTVHWSESKDYVPSDHYWNINKKESKKEVRKLELVVSNIETKIPKKNDDPEKS